MECPLTRASLEAVMVRTCAATLLGVKPANMFTFSGRFDASCAVCDDAPAPCSPCAVPIGVEASRERLRALVAEVDGALAPAGARVTVLAWRPFGALVYVYRPELVAGHLADARGRAMLAGLGYPVGCGASADTRPARLARSVPADGTVLSGPSGPSGDGGRGPSPSSSREPRLGAVPGRRGAPSPLLDRLLTHLRSRFALTPVPHEIGFFLGYPVEDVLGFIEHEGRDYRCLGCWKVYGDVRAAQRSFARYRRCARRCQRLYGTGVPLAELARIPRGADRCAASA